MSRVLNSVIKPGMCFMTRYLSGQLLVLSGLNSRTWSLGELLLLVDSCNLVTAGSWNDWSGVKQLFL